MTTTDETAPPAHSAGLLQWSVADRGDQIDIGLTGELDLATADELTELLTGLAGRRRVRVVCDLAQVSFLDSTGIRALLTAANAAEAIGSAVVIRNPTASVLRVLTICGVDTLLLDTARGDAAERR